MDLSYLVSPRGGDVHPACAVRGVHSPVNTHRPLGHDGVIPEYRPLIGPSTRLIGHWPGAVLEGPHVPHHSRGTLYDVRNSPGVSELPWQSPPEIVHIQPHVIINLDNEPRSSTIPCHGQHCNWCVTNKSGYFSVKLMSKMSLWIMEWYGLEKIPRMDLNLSLTIIPL